MKAVCSGLKRSLQARLEPGKRLGYSKGWTKRPLKVMVYHYLRKCPIQFEINFYDKGKKIPTNV